jgi:hypothetical protein
VYYDLVIQDAIGMPYNGSTVVGIGGSEFAVIKLAKLLGEQNIKVLIRNNTEETVEIGNVRYENRYTAYQAECKTLLLQRWTDLPFNVEFDRIAVWAHDIPGSQYNHFMAFFHRLDTRVICLSKWQRSLYPVSWNSEIIDPLLPKLDFQLAKDKDQNSFIFPSAAIKGWDETLKRWQIYKRVYSELLDAKLYVIDSGYDVATKVNDSSVVYLPKLNDNQLWTIINRCAGLFYINTFNECYPVTCKMAELAGTRTHILCLNGFGGIKDTLEDHRFITDDQNEFIQVFLGVYGSSLRQTATKQYSEEQIIKKWRTTLQI